MSPPRIHPPRESLLAAVQAVAREQFPAGSIFVIAGAVNPTATIQALALYIADAIKKNIDACSTDHERTQRQPALRRRVPGRRIAMNGREGDDTGTSPRRR
jgi:hypothetical protein